MGFFFENPEINNFVDYIDILVQHVNPPAPIQTHCTDYFGRFSSHPNYISDFIYYNIYELVQPSSLLSFRSYHSKDNSIYNGKVRHCILGQAYLTHKGQRSMVNSFHALYDSHVEKSLTLKGHLE